MRPEELLSTRELQIAHAYAGGNTYMVIADDLRIAPSTVRTHLAAIYRKLAVSSKLQLHARLTGEVSKGADQTDHAAVISELALSLEDALRREKALAEVLRIINRAKGEADVVMTAILDFALDLCEAEFGILFRYDGAGHFAMNHALGIPSAFADWLKGQGDFKVGSRTGLGRLAATKQVVNILDIRAEEIFRSGDPLRQATASLGGARSFVAIPMTSGNDLVGAFTIYRQSVRPFSTEATTLAQTFADQSVIAIDNARMVSEVRHGATTS